MAADSITKSIDISIISPCYNEQENLPELVDRLKAILTSKKVKFEIILIDDCSTDNTKLVILDLEKKYDFVKGVYHDVNKGIERGWNSGVAVAEGFYICTIDSDLQNLPEDAYRLYREARYSNADVVQGYRSSIGRLKDSRFILSKGLNFLLNCLFGMKSKDNKSGFIVCPKNVFLEILDHKYSYYAFQSFITVAAHSKKYSIKEVETLFQNRKYGDSFIKRFPVLLVIKCLIDIFKGFFEYAMFPKRESLLSGFLKEFPVEPKINTMTLNQRIYFNFYFLITPLHKWLITRKARNYYDELNQSQWLSSFNLKELQLRKFKLLIQHAYFHVPFYREAMDDRNLKMEDIKKLEDIQKFPLLQKQDVRKHIHFDLLSDNHKKQEILKIQTSGSTGEPLVIYADKHQLELRWASTQRGLEWAGYRFGDKCMRLWHQTIGMNLLKIARERMDSLLTRRSFIPVYKMNSRNLGQVIQTIKSRKPTLIDGYAESFNLLATYLKFNPTEIKGVNGIVTSAQELPDQSRKIISENFGCGVFDKYGCREFSGVAYECEDHSGHHVVDENFIVEILRDGRPAQPGEIGEIVITDLTNRCMPMIRYQLGDLAVAMDNSIPCPCGRGLSKIGKIEGRVQAMIVGDNDQFLPGTFFAHFFKEHMDLIQKYQIIQEEDGEITLKIIKSKYFDDSKFHKVITDLKQYLGHSTNIDLQFVDEISLVKTGKHQGAISKLKIDFQKIQRVTNN